MIPDFAFSSAWHYGYLGYPTQAARELDKTLELAPKDDVAEKVRDAFGGSSSKSPAHLLQKSQRRLM
jgi:hypothetical protein